MSTMDIITQIVTAFLGSLGFSVLFNLRRTKLLIAALGGMLSWGLFLLLGIWVTSEPIRYFFAAAFVTVYAEIFARIKKTPTTSYLVPGFIPMIPGGALYSTMKFALNTDWQLFGKAAAYTLQIALCITAGIVVVSSGMRMIVAAYRYLRNRFGVKEKI